MGAFPSIPRQAAVVVGVLCWTACGPSCDCLTPASADVAGHITTPTGAAVVGATVIGYAAPPSDTCSLGAESGLTTTGTGGQYSLGLAYGITLDSACVFVKVRAQQGSSLRDTVAGPFRLTFRYSAPIDHVVVDVVLDSL